MKRVHRTGVEPVTTRSEAGYSIRLSYRCKPWIVIQVGILEKTEAIVLRSFIYKEKSRILTLFTKEYGMISLIIPKISRKECNLLPLSSVLSRGEYLFTKGRSSLYRFEDGSLLDEHLFLRQKWSYIKLAGEMTQLILKSQLPEKPAPMLYALFISYLKQIPHFTNEELLLGSFYLKFLQHEGVLEIESFSRLAQIRSFKELEQETLSSQDLARIKTLATTLSILR